MLGVGVSCRKSSKDEGAQYFPFQAIEMLAKAIIAFLLAVIVAAVVDTSRW